MTNARESLLLAALLLAGTSLISASALGQPKDPTPFCGDNGVWLQILGGGGPDLNDGQAGASYVVFVDNRARLLVDMAPGASVGFDQSGARLADLEAAVFTQLHADHTADFPAFVTGAADSGRQDPLPVLGPDGDDDLPGTVALIDRLIGAAGAYPYLAENLSFRTGGFKFSPRDIPASGQRRTGGLGGGTVDLSAIPVHHGDVPALAWRAEIDGKSIVFTGDFNNQKNVMTAFAEGADALVIHHAVPDNARGTSTDLFVTPTQIGRIAADAGVRMIVLGHRTSRTRGLESLSRQAIEAHYQGSLIFANDLECWGL